MFNNLFLAVSPEILLLNATFCLLIHGVVLSTCKKYDYPPLVCNVGWLGLLSVSRLGGKLLLDGALATRERKVAAWGDVFFLYYRKARKAYEALTRGHMSPNAALFDVRQHDT